MLPAAGAEGHQPRESTPTTLYFHLFDTLNAFPVNTQLPDVEHFVVGGHSFPTVASQGYDFNTIYGFATAGPVEYGFIENGQARFHRERGIAADVLIDDAVQPVAFLYIDVRDLLGGQVAPNALPSLTFRFEMREGNAVGQEKDLDGLPLIMDGQLTLDVADGQAAGALNAQAGGQTNPATGNPIVVPDPDGVVEFRIPLALAAQRIPKASSYHLRIDWYQNPTGDASNDDQYAEGYLRLVSDARHHPRLEMAILNPVYVEFLHPQVAAGILLVHAGVNSPWGTYDADIANMTIEVTGPSQPRSLQQVVSANTHIHDRHDEAAEVTYLWRFRDEGAAVGDYTIKVRVPNLAHTAAAEHTAGFRIEEKRAYGIVDGEPQLYTAQEDASQESPAAGAGAVAALAFALLVHRTRHRPPGEGRSRRRRSA